MYHLVLLFAALLSGSRSANVNKHMRILANVDNSINRNTVSSKESPIKLFEVKRHPRPLIAHTPGTTIELTCEAFGSPAPSIHWYKNDAPVFEHDMESSELIDTNPASLARLVSTLLVSRTEIEDQYRCVMKSGANIASASTTVYRTDGTIELTERFKLNPFAPRILVFYRAYVDHIGNNVVLPCRAKGHPRPQIAWTHRGNGELNATSVRNGPRVKILRSGELVISPLLWADMGEYTCHATNAFGSQLASTFVYPAKAG